MPFVLRTWTWKQILSKFPNFLVKYILKCTLVHTRNVLLISSAYLAVFHLDANKVTKGIIEVLATMKNSRCVESSQAESENTQNDGGIAGWLAALLGAFFFFHKRTWVRRLAHKTDDRGFTFSHEQAARQQSVAQKETQSHLAKYLSIINPLFQDSI